MKFTAKQTEALKILAGDSTHGMLFGGSRSGKTFLHVRNIVLRALKAPESRHAIFRFRLNHLIASVWLDTFPKVMKIAFPGVEYKTFTQDRYIELSNGSQIWFAGLDDKDRTEKVLGMEFVTVYFNECSQIPYSSVATALTRLAQKVDQTVKGAEKGLKLRAFYDCNPPNKGHWTYKIFIEKRLPDTREPLPNGNNYISYQINPSDNVENLSEEYLDQLKALPARMRIRFLDGNFSDDNPHGLFPQEVIEKWREKGEGLPQMVRVIVGVDPSGSGDVDNADNDEIGIVVGGLGIDGNAYLLEDCTIKAGPGTWGRIATDAFDRHQADCIVGEINFGGAMVQQTIQVARPRTPFKKVTASRGKIARAEPFSAMYESGKVRHAGIFIELEDELNGFSTFGYTGSDSPNRADAWFWVLAELFPAIAAPRKKVEVIPIPNMNRW